MLLFLLLAVSAPKTQGAYDEVRQLPDGQTLIMRTLDWDLGDGTKERVIVHWLLQEDGRMRYDFDRQPPQTQEAHRRSCARQGMQPSRGVGMIAGKGPHTVTAAPALASGPRLTPPCLHPRMAWTYFDIGLALQQLRYHALPPNRPGTRRAPLHRPPADPRQR